MNFGRFRTGLDRGTGRGVILNIIAASGVEDFYFFYFLSPNSQQLTYLP